MLEEQHNAVATVRELLAALEVRDLQKALDLLHPDFVWKNTGLPDVRGADRMASLLRATYRDWIGYAADVHHIAADGDVVLTERTDVMRFGPLKVSSWVAGTFELRDGRIILWRDRYSYWAAVRSAVAAPIRAVVADA